MQFPQNVGTTDRNIRIVIGIVILGFGIAFKSWFGLIGILPLVTALLGRCSLYLPFGLSTCELKSKAAAKSR